MNAMTLSAPSPLRSYLLEARCEFLRLLRTPSFAVPTLLFPPMFYLLFGVLLNGGHGRGPHAATWLLATYGVFGVMAPGLFGFGVSVALDRERGFLALKRALPVPTGALLLAKMAMAMVFAAVIATVLIALATTLGGVSVAPSRLALLWLVDVLGVLPFCAIGLYVGALVGGQGAPALINLIYLPMAFLAGLWLPLSALPAVFAKLAPLWPAYHLAQVALPAVGLEGTGSVAGHVAVLAATGLVFFAAARRRLARA